MSHPSSDRATERVVLLLGIGTAVSLLGDSTLYTVLPRPDVAAEAGVTLAMVGVLLGANRAIRLLTNGVAGILYDRLPRRPLLVASLFAGALSTLVFAVGRGPASLLISRMLWGAAWSGIWVGGNAVVLDVSTAENRGRLSGALQTWFFIGTGGAAFIGGALTDFIGFRLTLLLGAGLTGLAAALWLLALPRGETGAPVHRFTRPAASSDRFPWSVAIRAAIPLIVTRFVFAGIVSATVALWLRDLVGQGLPLGRWLVPLGALTGALVAVRAVVSLTGAQLAGRLSDRRGRRWPMSAAALLVGAVGQFFAASASVPLAIAGAVLASITVGGVQAIVPAIAGDQGGPSQRARILSVAYTLGDLSSAVAPPLALALVGALSVDVIYRLCAGLLALTAVFAAWQARGERS